MIDGFLVVERGQVPGGVRVFVLKHGSSTIGRQAPGAMPDIPIDDDYVSRKQAEVILRDNTYLLRDLGSRNGTLLNGQPLRPETTYELKDNALIGLAVVEGEPRILLRFRTSSLTQGGALHHSGQPNAVHWLAIDTQKKEATVDGRSVYFPRKEYELLVFLNLRRGIVCARDEIIANVWPDVANSRAVSNEMVDQLIHRLRDKVEVNPRKATRIVSKKGFGYMLV
jgi:hypothetical protein